ncbi:hypothetical protein SEUCBS139899_002693 [Sporothrix eucalyptigena]|uniref:Uncharacterized protein n=1 Tax=Sporothrix eucalyptigena TaxID=1812306 RepID=A0ABP0BBT0_9PEZI
MDEMTASRDNGTFDSAVAVPVPLPADDPELLYPFYHQRGRRRRRSPLPLPYYDGLNVPFSLAMTSVVGNHTQRPQNHPPRVPPRPKNRPRPRQETPSGSSGTFRGRRRHRSPSIGPTSAYTAAIRKASTRPTTRSSSVASSMRHASRPSSPHECRGAANGWVCRSISRSRGRAPVVNNSNSKNGKRGLESPSPRRKVVALRASMDMDHHGLVHHHNNYDYNHHLFQTRQYTKPLSRRSHCPSRSGSAEGYHHDEDMTSSGIMRVDGASSSVVDPVAMASRRRRRRQRTQSRPRPRRTMTGESMSATNSNHDVFGVTSYYTLDSGSNGHIGLHVNEPIDATMGPSRPRFQMLLGDSSDTTSDGDAMDVEIE